MQDTELLILGEHISPDIDLPLLPTFNEEEISSILFYIEITRCIQEIYQLFQVFRFNFNNLFHFYTLFNTDKVKRKITFDFNTRDFFAINALTINYISSGKTLIEAIESSLKQNMGEGSELYKIFKAKCLNKKYDDCFSYRLLLRLRDFSQHGHLPVSMDYTGTYCFNLDHILLTPHFNHNSTLKQQMEKFTKELHEEHLKYPKIAFTYSFAEFNLCITEIYVEFLNVIESTLQTSVDKIKSLLFERPDIIHKSLDVFDGAVFYQIDDEKQIHSFNSQDDVITMFLGFKEEALKILKEEQAEWNRINSNIKKVKL